MKCPYCDTEFEIEALEEYQKEIASPAHDSYGWDTGDLAEDWEAGELDDLSQCACPSCGAEILGDKNAVAMVCPNCGNSQIVSKRLTGLLEPDYVIPFQLDKKTAMQALKDFYKGKRLLPDSFKEGNRINGIQGIYLPFWLFDAEAKGHICYKATKKKTWSDANYNYIKTDYYSVVRDGGMAFEKIPVDGSERMDDNYMDAIEPFNYAQLQGFQTAFLSGYPAEKYDVDADKTKPRAEQRIKNSVETEFRKSVTGYTTVSTESSTVTVAGGKVSYGLFPVWILNTKFKKENYLFLMNGQTGRLVGKLPVDKGKFIKYLSLIAGITGAVLTVIIQALRIFV
jgi:predicted RNA-binding Zn-ribbon protein involved in translation (DUF1610 family)